MRRSRIATLTRAGIAGCATTLALAGGVQPAQAQIRNGRGEAQLDKPPYYAGRAPAPSTARIGHLPISYQRGAGQAPIFDPAAGEEMLALLGEMNAYLDSLGVSVRLAAGGSVSAVAHADTRQPPDVSFGCATAPMDDADACAMPDDDVPGGGQARMRLAVARPAAEWAAWAGEVMRAAGADRALVITLEVGFYPVRQSGLRGRKQVLMGTDYAEPLPWLTGLDRPVAVLQLTGALVDSTGQATRIGAEGLLARRTTLAVGALGGQRLITDDDVRALRTARRGEGPDAPLAWQAGLRAMVEGLLRPRGR